MGSAAATQERSSTNSVMLNGENLHDRRLRIILVYMHTAVELLLDDIA